MILCACGQQTANSPAPKAVVATAPPKASTAENNDESEKERLAGFQKEGLKQCDDPSNTKERCINGTVLGRRSAYFEQVWMAVCMPALNDDSCKFIHKFNKEFEQELNDQLNKTPGDRNALQALEAPKHLREAIITSPKWELVEYQMNMRGQIDQLYFQQLKAALYQHTLTKR